MYGAGIVIVWNRNNKPSQGSLCKLAYYKIITYLNSEFLIRITMMNFMIIDTQILISWIFIILVVKVCF